MLEAVMPKLRLLRCVGAEIAAEGARILQITEDQRVTLQGLLASERVLVEGTAGSGKTLLALEFAVSLSAMGKKVLLLCFNRHLATWLQEQARGESRLRNREDLLEIATFHAYAFKLAHRAHVEFEIPERDAGAFWEEDVPLILEQALDILREEGHAPLFDALVVDEAQDFSRDWWVTVESLTRYGRTGRLYVFLDLHQSLWGEHRVPPVPLPTKLKLTTNCRNTRAIARSASCLVRAEITLLPGSPEGELPAIHRAGTPAAEAGLVLAEVRRFLRGGGTPQQIVLLGPAAYENGSLAFFREVDGVALVSEAAAWRRGAGVLVTTARAFKGLEADIVLLYDLARFGTTFTLTDLYVAWTRARHRLLIVCHGAEVRTTIEEVLAEAERLISGTDKPI
jgi:superfamily I DNA/RNA helicase